MERKPLVLLPATLSDAGFDETPTYRQCYDAALARRIPASRSAKGRWTFDPADLELIAQGLGLVDAPANAA